MNNQILEKRKDIGNYTFSIKKYEHDLGLCLVWFKSCNKSEQKYFYFKAIYLDIWKFVLHFDYGKHIDSKEDISFKDCGKYYAILKPQQF